MAQYYTLEEAARKLGLTTDDFRRRLQTEWKSTPKRFPDGATLRFQVREIDELARTLGGSSEADLPLRLADDSSEEFVTLGNETKPSGSGKSKKPGSDSDVRLDLAGGNVRPSARNATEVDLDATKASKPPSSNKIKPASQIKKDSDASSDFDLSLTSDSSDEFELQLTDDSDEVDIGATPKNKKGKPSGDSGINLQSPADSGISLEKSSDFELALEGESGLVPKTGPLGGPKPGPKTPKPSALGADDSEFELTLDDQSDATTAFPEGEQKDIFETDFELPALDDESGSEAVALEESDTDLESSDFDLAIDEGDAAADEESGSQVVALDDEGGTPHRRRRGEDDLDEVEEFDEDAEPAAVRSAAPPAKAEWGVLPALVLIPCVIVMGLVGLMSWELVRGMWGYQQPGRAQGPIVRFFAETFGSGKLPAE